jgi:hypothetical protein
MTTAVKIFQAVNIFAALVTIIILLPDTFYKGFSGFDLFLIIYSIFPCILAFYLLIVLKMKYIAMFFTFGVVVILAIAHLPEFLDADEIKAPTKFDGIIMMLIPIYSVIAGVITACSAFCLRKIVDLLAFLISGSRE